MAAAAMVAVFAFILTRGSSTESTTEEDLRGGSVPNGVAGAPAQAVPTPSTNPEPSLNTAKADRRPPPSITASRTRTSAPVNTGPEAPAFKRGQWIVVLDTYPADVGLEADQLAKGTAAKLIAAGVPAKAMLANGQYPGLANSAMEPVAGTWVVYLGPGNSSEQMLDLCSAPKTQRAYNSPACPTYEPAAAAGN